MFGGRIMRTKESEEMYLETIYRIGKTKSDVHAIDVAVELGYSKPSVSRAVGLLKKRGYITVAPTGVITLTEQGKAKAEGVFERHEVITAALEKMGVQSAEAEENACRIEHVITEAAFRAIKAFAAKGE